ncbi:hypothetical protein KDA_53550 [Dictyobacter alpinus]|uniref:N-acetyltransferase domain-containing protein n=1 Tax=Dictyobacter alpinus TaxID=2014873 RepID=A0A402BEL1_9CHLR|nr:GNAT family N-acetyltransferase [Dictyobacter alpinus]GCE29871.1 hypothetical protein KDA_53550 [Dictyobacter alpinus]
MHPVMNNSFQRDLGDGLVLRWSTAEDIERIATLHSFIHRANATEAPNSNAIRIIRAHMSGDYPLMGPQDFVLVEDTTKEDHPVVATACLWKQTWSYEGIPFSVGRPEWVATDPAYRNRGLVRALFEQLHARSEADGDLVQIITGIAYFYRQFGYEYALELEDRRATPLVLIPERSAEGPEPLTLREATPTDIPTIEALYQRRQSTSIVRDVPTHQQWLYEIDTWKKHPEWRHTFAFQMLVSAAGETIGFLASNAYRSGKTLVVWLLEFVDGVNIHSLMPAVLRALRAYGHALETTRPGIPAFQEISFSLGTTHPVHALLGPALDYPKEPAYAWYIRVKDLPAFLKHIAPVLERRLALSPVAGYSGELSMDFYRSGLRMRFEHGRLLDVEEWRTTLYGPEADSAFPPLVFLQILFGHRSIDELRHILPDIWISTEVRPLLLALFPTRPSCVFTWN